jgi:hypothetical protein
MPIQGDFPERNIDHTRRGILTISDGFLLALLGLDARYMVEELRITTLGNLQIEIVGGDMPDGNLPKPVTLLCHVNGKKRRQFSWAHMPEKRWA